MTTTMQYTNTTITRNNTTKRTNTQKPISTPSYTNSGGHITASEYSVEIEMQ
jgi:hypothetical protein